MKKKNVTFTKNMFNNKIPNNLFIGEKLNPND